ncbi:MAG TPA: hypothetical protein VF221_20925 [Chloroflexota bacterium]
MSSRSPSEIPRTARLGLTHAWGMMSVYSLYVVVRVEFTNFVAGQAG